MNKLGYVALLECSVVAGFPPVLFLRTVPLVLSIKTMSVARGQHFVECLLICVKREASIREINVFKCPQASEKLPLTLRVS